MYFGDNMCCMTLHIQAKYRPVDLLEKEPLKVHLYTLLRCSAINRRAKGAELDSAAASKRSRCSVWHEAGAYII